MRAKQSEEVQAILRDPELRRRLIPALLRGERLRKFNLILAGKIRGKDNRNGAKDTPALAPS